MGTLSCVGTRYGVLPDWLTVTFPPGALHDETGVLTALAEAGYVRVEGFSNGEKRRYRHPAPATGSVVWIRCPRYHLLSFSGGACRTLDSAGCMRDVIADLCVVSGLRVTRLDLAQDTDHGSVLEVARILRRLKLKAYDGGVKLSRKWVPMSDCDWIENARRLDGEGVDGARWVETGCLLLGKRSNTVYARVYDKRAEMASRYDVDIGTERVRVEVCANRGRATLRDFVDPDPLFFSIAAPHLVARPREVEHWRQTDMDPRELPPVRKRTDYERLVALADACFELEVMAELLRRSPNLAPIAMRKIEQRLGLETRSADRRLLAG